MQTTSKAKITYKAIGALVVLNILLFIFLKGKHLYLFGVLLLPFYSAINQFFTHYTITQDALIIKELFETTEISLDKIRNLEQKKSHWTQIYLAGMPDEHQIIRYNKFDDKPIFPRKELIFVPASQELYFKN